jgi:hypothetical protein
MDTYHTSTQEAEEVGSRIQAQPGIYRKFEASLEYLKRLCQEWKEGRNVGMKEQGKEGRKEGGKLCSLLYL